MLAMSDKNGIVEGSIPGLADMARVSVEDCNAALNRLLLPDAYSRTKDHEGRRIEVIDGGWQLLNHGKYRAKMSADERREYNRQKQAEHRQKLSTNVKNVNDVSALSAHSEAEAEAEAVKKDADEPHPTPAVDLASLAKMDCYKHIDVPGELQKMQNWCTMNKKHASMRRFVNWLNRIDKPLVAAPGAPAMATKPRTVFELKTIIEAKQREADMLFNKHASAGPLSTDWNNDAARRTYVRLRTEIKDLNRQLSGMA